MSLLENKLKEKLTIVILCAGEGKRLKKIAKNTPKPLLKIKGLENESILQNTIFKLIKLGIKQITIIIGHLGSTIREFVSSLTKKDLSLQNKLVINTADQYKLGSLYSLLSITRNKSIFTRDKYYLLMPGDTIFDVNLLREILSITSKNVDVIKTHPVVFYRTLKLEEVNDTSKIISHAEIEKFDSENILKRISQIKIKKSSSRDVFNQIIPVSVLNYGFVNELLNLKEKIPYKTVWESLNYMIINGKKIYAFKIENKHQFYDIDDKNDLNILKKKRKGQ